MLRKQTGDLEQKRSKLVAKKLKLSHALQAALAKPEEDRSTRKARIFSARMALYDEFKKLRAQFRAHESALRELKELVEAGR